MPDTIENWSNRMNGLWAGETSTRNSFTEYRSSIVLSIKFNGRNVNSPNKLGHRVNVCSTLHYAIVVAQLYLAHYAVDATYVRIISCLVSTLPVQQMWRWSFEHRYVERTQSNKIVRCFYLSARARSLHSSLHVVLCYAARWCFIFNHADAIFSLLDFYDEFVSGIFSLVYFAESIFSIQTTNLQSKRMNKERSEYIK